MTRPAWTRSLDPMGWLLIVAGVAVFAVGAWWFLSEPGRARQRAAEAKAGQVISQGDNAATVAAAVASDQLNERSNDLKDLSRNNTDDILKAKGAADPVAPGVHDAQLRAQCVHQFRRDDPECVRLRQADSAKHPR